MTFELYVSFEMMRMLSLMQRYSHFRWLDQLEAPLVVLEPGGMAIHLHLLHQWVSLRFLPPRRKFCDSWFKLSNNRGVGIMLITHKKRATKISSVLSLRCSIKRIRTIESKFSLLTTPCSEANKTRYAAQQLCGSARMWWDHYHGMLPADHVVNWNEFKLAF